MDSILWRFKDSAGHDACFTLGDVAALLVMLLVLFVFSVFMAKRKKACLAVRNYLLLPFTAIGGFVIYWIGYLSEGTANSLVALSIRSFLSTFHMFFLHSDLLEVCKEMHENEIYITFFSVVHFLAFLVSFLIILQLFGKHFLSWLRLKFSSGEKAYIFFGVNRASVSLGKSLSVKPENRGIVVFLDRKIHRGMDIGLKTKSLRLEFRNRETMLEQVNRMDALLLNKEYSEGSTLKGIGIGKLMRRKNVCLFFLSDGMDYNIQSALKVCDEIGRDENYRGNITLYVRADEDYMADVFEEKANRNIDIQMVNPAKLSARELVTRFPPVDYVQPDNSKALATKDFNAMILGFGKVGAYSLRFLSEQGQFVGSDFRVVVVDKDIDNKAGVFKSRFPGMEHFDIEYKNLNVNSLDFWNLLEGRLNVLDYVVVSLGDTELNVATAINIHRFIDKKADHSIDIFVKVHDNADIDLMKVTAQSFGHIHVFGSDEDIFTEEIVINEAQMSLAKKIHHYYDEKKEENKKTDWKYLTSMKKISNISAAFHIAVKLKMMGMSVEDVEKFSNEFEFLSVLGAERLENLAKGEHLHWNATLFSNEWDVWKLIPADRLSNKDDKRKLHACLVSWEELEKVEQRFGEPYREYDRDCVKKVYGLVCGKVIFR